jgi:FtsZ-binding cell division protein ZapB
MTKSITEDSLKRILDDKFRPVEDKVKELVKTVEFISAKYDELLSKQINIEAVSNGLVKENEILKSQVSNLQNRVEQLSTNVNDLQQYGCRECLEMCGVPFRDDELVVSISSLINVNIQPQDISISHRLKTRMPTRNSTPTQNSTPAIIMKFVSRTTRDRLYYARKHLKDKTTSDIGFGRISDNKIYIAESLTSKNKELFKKCLDARRSLNYKFIWTN